LKYVILLTATNAKTDVKPGTVIGKCMRRHRAVDLRKFLAEVERLPAARSGLDITGPIREAQHSRNMHSPRAFRPESPPGREDNAQRQEDRGNHFRAPHLSRVPSWPGLSASRLAQGHRPEEDTRERKWCGATNARACRPESGLCDFSLREWPKREIKIATRCDPTAAGACPQKVLIKTKPNLEL
jgi:hypothetical protein